MNAKVTSQEVKLISFSRGKDKGSSSTASNIQIGNDDSHSIAQASPSKTTREMLSNVFKRLADAFSGVINFFSKGELSSISRNIEVAVSQRPAVSIELRPIKKGEAYDLEQKALEYKELADAKMKEGNNQFTSWLGTRSYGWSRSAKVGHPLEEKAVLFQQGDCYLQLSKDCEAAATALKNGETSKHESFQKAIGLGEEAITLSETYKERLKTQNKTQEERDKNHYFGQAVLHTMGEAIITSKMAESSSFNSQTGLYEEAKKTALELANGQENTEELKKKLEELEQSIRRQIGEGDRVQVYSIE